MLAQDLEKLRYPIGTFDAPEIITDARIDHWVGDIGKLPAQLRETVAGLNAEQLKTPYRPGGWTVQQTVNHVADSHMNAYIRFHWTLTEETPTIKAYNEKLWADLPDGQHAPIELSLSLLDSLHQRWVFLLDALSDADLDKQYFHPDSQRHFDLRFVIGMYAWHGRHHTAHIAELKKRMGW